jgi:exosortase
MSLSRVAKFDHTKLRSDAANRSPMSAWLIGIGLFLVIVATYWRTIWPLWKDWQRDDNYSVGQLVPLAALYMVWHARNRLRDIDWRPCWWGIVPLLAAQGARYYGLVAVFESAERYALVLTIVSVVLLVGGWERFKRLGWVMAFLFLMVPFPGKIHNFISNPLQSWATMGAVFFLEITGATVVRQGNVVLLENEMPLAVAEACSGLRMLTAFIVVGATLAFLMRRSLWQKLVVTLSSIPVAIMCNMVRIFLTAWLYTRFDGEVAETFFHDFAGLLMMPLAVGILIGEIWLLGQIFVQEDE